MIWDGSIHQFMMVVTFCAQYSWWCLTGLEVNKEIKTFLAAYPSCAQVVEGALFGFLWLPGSVKSVNGGSVAWCSLVPFHPSGCEDSLHEVCEKRGILGLREAMQTIIGSLRLWEDLIWFNVTKKCGKWLWVAKNLQLRTPSQKFPRCWSILGRTICYLLILYDLIVFVGFFSRYHFHPFKMVFYRIPTVFYRYYFHRWPPGGLTRQP